LIKREQALALANVFYVEVLATGTSLWSEHQAKLTGCEDGFVHLV